jgi:hypothetical protein
MVERRYGRYDSNWAQYGLGFLAEALFYAGVRFPFDCEIFRVKWPTDNCDCAIENILSDIEQTPHEDDCFHTKLIQALPPNYTTLNLDEQDAILENVLISLGEKPKSLVGIFSRCTCSKKAALEKAYKAPHDIFCAAEGPDFWYKPRNLKIWFGQDGNWEFVDDLVSNVKTTPEDWVEIISHCVRYLLYAKKNLRKEAKTNG